MAYSSCPKCSKTYFEVVEKSPAKSTYKLIFVQCSSCGAVVGTMDYWNIGTLIKELENKMGSSSSNSNIMSALVTINDNLIRLSKRIGAIEEKIDSKK